MLADFPKIQKNIYVNTYITLIKDQSLEYLFVLAAEELICLNAESWAWPVSVLVEYYIPSLKKYMCNIVAEWKEYFPVSTED